MDRLCGSPRLGGTFDLGMVCLQLCEGQSYPKLKFFAQSSFQPGDKRRRAFFVFPKRRQSSKLNGRRPKLWSANYLHKTASPGFSLFFLNHLLPWSWLLICLITELEGKERNGALNAPPPSSKRRRRTRKKLKRDLR